MEKWIYVRWMLWDWASAAGNDNWKPIMLAAKILTRTARGGSASGSCCYIWCFSCCTYTEIIRVFSHLGMQPVSCEGLVLLGANSFMLMHALVKSFMLIHDIANSSILMPPNWTADVRGQPTLTPRPLPVRHCIQWYIFVGPCFFQVIRSCYHRCRYCS